MRFIRKNDLRGSARHVRNDAYDTIRFLLAADGVGVTVTDNTLAPGIEETYGHDRHTEIAYCLEGEATITDSAGGRHDITPGTMWVADPGERFRFVASTPTRVICVFTPPFRGDESGFAADMAAAP